MVEGGQQERDEREGDREGEGERFICDMLSCRMTLGQSKIRTGERGKNTGETVTVTVTCQPCFSYLWVQSQWYMFFDSLL